MKSVGKVVIKKGKMTEYWKRIKEKKTSNKKVIKLSENNENYEEGIFKNGLIHIIKKPYFSG